MVRISAESNAVKEMIEQNLPVLKNDLQQHGLEIDKFDVYVGHDDGAWRQRRQQNASGQESQYRSAQGGSPGVIEDNSEEFFSTDSRRIVPGGGRGGIDFFA
jgi:flagellar hook-length control protein FliK